jgi:conjugal transfer pilus assembly protein TraB
MNSSRAEILVTRLSCSATKEDGSRVKIEHEAAPIGWVIGEDGKYGVSGRLVDSAGKILTRQLSVGFLQGVSMAFATPNMGVVPYGSTSIINCDTVNRGLSTGASQGVGTAFNSLADYYTKMLDGVYPYVDVKPGRKVTILFKGFEDVVKTEYEAITINDDSFIESDIEEIEIDYEDF